MSNSKKSILQSIVLVASLAFYCLTFQINHAFSDEINFKIFDLDQRETFTEELVLNKQNNPVSIELTVNLRSEVNSTDDKFSLFVEISDVDGVFFGSVVSFSASEADDDLNSLIRRGSHLLQVQVRNSGPHQLSFSPSKDSFSAEIVLPKIESVSVNIQSNDPLPDQPSVTVDEIVKAPVEKRIPADPISEPENEDIAPEASDKDEGTWSFGWLPTILLAILIWFLIRRLRNKKTERKKTKWGRAGSEDD